MSARRGVLAALLKTINAHGHSGPEAILVIIWITIFIDLVGVTLITPYINDFVEELGDDVQVVELLLASYATMQLIFAPVWGRRPHWPSSGDHHIGLA